MRQLRTRWLVVPALLAVAGGCASSGTTDDPLTFEQRKAKHETLAKEDLPDIPVSALAEDLPVTEELIAALQQLPEDRREAVILHHIHGFTFKEIGSMLGITSRAAKLRSFRGVQNLRGMLGEDGA